MRILIAGHGPGTAVRAVSRKGTLMPGADAGIVVFDPAAERTLSAASGHSSVDYSCYEGLRVHGRPDIVLARDRVLVENGQSHGVPGSGQFIARTLPAGAAATPSAPGWQPGPLRTE
jgi:dihydropyrimidinase